MKTTNLIVSFIAGVSAGMLLAEISVITFVLSGLKESMPDLANILRIAIGGSFGVIIYMKSNSLLNKITEDAIPKR